MEHKRGGVFYGWYLVAACFVINFFVFGISVNTFTVYVKPIEADFEWSRKAISAAMLLAAVAMGIAAPFMGRLIDRLGARLVMAVGTALVGGCSLLLARTNSLPYFYMVYILAGIGQAGATVIPISYVISNWFNVGRGRALGIVMTGTGLGAMVMVPVTTWIIVNWDWRISYSIMGGIILLMIPVDLLFVRTRPSDMGLQADGGIISDAKPIVLTGLAFQEAVKTTSFWLIGAMMFFSGLVAMGIGVHLMPYLTDIGHSEMTASRIIMIISGLTVIGKIGIGVIADRWGIQQAIVLTFAVIIAGIFLLMGAKGLIIACVFAIVYGFAIGAPLLVNPALTADCMGLKAFGPIFGILTLLNTFGVAIGAVLPGAFYDSFKSYMPAFWLFILLMAIAGSSGVMAHRKKPEPAY